MKPQIKKQNNNHGSELSSAVLNRIKSEKVTPTARFIFTCINCMVWSAWAFSVIIGAISVAVLLYVGDHARFALYEATHTTPLSFFIEVLPYIWITVFVLMGAFAYFNMKHTKSGYKYPMWQLLISSLLFSIVGGAVLQFFGAGYLIDTQLAKRMPIYKSLEQSEQRMWQKPEEGRLVGVFDTMDEKEEVYTFVDRSDHSWRIQTKELRVVDRELLSSGNIVRVLGTTTDAVNRDFHACGVFPWMFDANVSIKEMKKDRRIFVERMYEHMEKGDRLRGLEREVFDKNETMPFEEGLCANLAAVKRMKF